MTGNFARRCVLPCRACIAAAALLLAQATAHAQQSTTTETTPTRRYAYKQEFGVWGGYSSDSIRLIGKLRDASFFVSALRYGRVLTNRDDLVLKYTLDIVPIAGLRYNDIRQVLVSPGVVQETRRRVYSQAFGVAPIGLQINFRPNSPIQPFIQGSIGFLYFNETTPTRTGKQFNLTADIGGGVQYFVAPKTALTLGYRYHHLSNGFQGQENPGIDSSIVYAGISLFR